MVCTDISYQQQSLPMQGSAGTFTSSRHPILGALIHFAPKLSHKKHGFQTNGGTVDPHWVARMRDNITVAGQQYKMRDRKHFEQDEGDWVMLSVDRSLVKYQEKSVREPAMVIGELRRRHVTRGKEASQSKESITTDEVEHSTTEVAAHKLKELMDFSTRRPQDGEWSWSLASKGPEVDKASTSHETGYLPLSSSFQSQIFPSPNWCHKLTSFLRRRLSATIFYNTILKNLASYQCRSRLGSVNTRFSRKPKSLVSNRIQR